ncbi:hypothetical protein J7S78_14070 [Klebsiella oxytoca]|uniref:Uncharacterized protein n=1 Tax=Klebsiella oxytoca TaxID=571 RepID=A0AAP2BJE6_KLEOX|nr:hypothetical protein [Klebsiella oxytoca]MBQ0600921.1 hypothetical protein [Klebsiella oxytoca]
MRTNNNAQAEAVHREIERSLNAGMSQVTIKKLTEILKDIGYRFDRSMDTCSQAQIITGDGAGDTYPTLVLYPIQDDGVSAFHYQARRDANYQKLKKIRNNLFAVFNNRIVVI